MNTMQQHQPVTSHHLNLFARFAPYLIEPQPEQPCDSVLGSVLAQIVSFDPSEVDGFDAILTFTHPLTQPRYSSTRLRAIHLIHFHRDLKVQRLEKLLGRITTHAFVWWEAPSCAVLPSALSITSIDYLAVAYAPVDFAIERTNQRSFKWDRGYHVCPAIDLPKQIVRFNQVTPEDVGWGLKSAFKHSRNMPPLLTNFCPNCSESVVAANKLVRSTRGMYLPIKHECPAQRVYNGVPERDERSVVVRAHEFPSEEAAQSHFENTLVVFVGDGGSLEAIEGFNHSPRANHSDQEEKDLLRWVQRTRVGVVVGPTCLRCGAPITKRKGTKYCSDDCRKRHNEERNNTQREE
jgi:hypothetical protein